VRPNILSVPQCSGCGRPRKEKIVTPFGTRSRFNRLKMTLVPGIVDVLPTQASGVMVRRRAVHAKLCKACRIVAFGSERTEAVAT
jgi:hypothetical protein